MKNIIICATAITWLISCTSTPPPVEKQEAPPKKGNGYTDVETENVKMVLRLNEAAMQNDTTALRGFYTSNTDTIHNNLEDITIDQNVQMLAQLQKMGITATISPNPVIWETVNDKPNAKGQTNFVIAYLNVTLHRSKKSEKVLFNQVCAIKNGKVVEEWDVYDTKPFDMIMK